MNSNEWIHTLEKDEGGYARRCHRLWKQGMEDGPTIPEGMSKTKADILRYHTKALLDTTRRTRKMEELAVISFKLPKELQQQVAMSAAEVDVNVSILIRTCIVLALPQIISNPKIINFFSESVIPK